MLPRNLRFKICPPLLNFAELASEAVQRHPADKAIAPTSSRHVANRSIGRSYSDYTIDSPHGTNMLACHTSQPAALGRRALASSHVLPIKVLRHYYTPLCIPSRPSFIDITGCGIIFPKEDQALRLQAFQETVSACASTAQAHQL